MASSMRGVPDPTLTLKPSPLNRLDLGGKHLVVIGGTDGLGRALARLSAARGATVTVVGRTFRDEGVERLRFVKADLSSMKDARRLGETLPVESADAVVLTTGIIAAKQRETTAEGVERDLAVSYLSRLAVLRGLTPRLGTGRPATSPPPRVFVMGFPGTGDAGDASDLNAEKSYDAMKVHLNTVAGNEALVLHGARHDARVRYFGLNPGLVRTNIRANYLGEGSLGHRLTELFIGLVMPSAERYAERLVPVLFTPELDGRTGVMVGSKGQAILPTEGFDAARVDGFIAASEALLERAVSGQLTR
ncbi:MAG: SDR family NAD(P)-dependent oxidoreductase [Myxococcaceae bacterium]|nr:SDR family NAD(P)-dependent oxidoreductase [Myxococcaceae bacterium]